jgi:hypothetical protein
MTAIAPHFSPSLLPPELRIASDFRYRGRAVEKSSRFEDRSGFSCLRRRGATASNPRMAERCRFVADILITATLQIMSHRS